jgi:hypothetical protein
MIVGFTMRFQLSVILFAVAGVLLPFKAESAGQNYADLSRYLSQRGVRLVRKDCARWPVCRVYWRLNARDGSSATAVLRVDERRNIVLPLR